jgi:nucleotide-binding universal stress UspA family protein
VATYLAERWKTALTILTLTEGGKIPASVQEYARSYLDLHEVKADFIVSDGLPDTILKLTAEHGINLVLMGGYSGTTLKEIFVGSMVNFLLREADCPILICR